MEAEHTAESCMLNLMSENDRLLERVAELERKAELNWQMFVTANTQRNDLQCRIENFVQAFVELKQVI